MSVTLPEVLSLVGRLDDAPGFDSPRERYRRFLIENVTDVATVRGLVDDCQRAVGEQRHRALQDLIVLVGRFLGFEIAFGAYETPMPLPGALHAGRPGDAVVGGRWRSRGQLDVALEVRTDQTADATLDGLTRTLSLLPPPHGATETRIGLSVMARHYAARSRLEQTVGPGVRFGSELRIVGVRSLIALATQVSARRVGHADVVKLFKSGFALDFVIDLLDRPALSPVSVDEPVFVPDDDPRDERFWVTTISGNETCGANQLLASLIAHRRVLGVCASGALQDLGMPGDWVCFFLPGKGIVGHARLAAIVDGTTSIRNASSFSRVYRLADVDLYEEPVVQALRAGRAFSPPAVDPSAPGPGLAPMTRQDFVAMTHYRGEAPAADNALRAIGPVDLISERRLRSPA
jgi:hypothetical protein